MTAALLTVADLAARLRMARSTFYAKRARLETAGMPAPINDTLAAVVGQRWRAAEIDAWLGAPPARPEPANEISAAQAPTAWEAECLERVGR